MCGSCEEAIANKVHYYKLQAGAFWGVFAQWDCHGATRMTAMIMTVTEGTAPQGALCS